MFEDILEKDTKPNKKIICPTCGTTVITIEQDSRSEEYNIENWDYECKQCSEKKNV